MNRTTRVMFCSLLVSITFGLLLSVQAVALESSGQVSDVTLYRGQALVTRTLVLDVKAGTTEVVVGPLPERIAADSLFTESNGGTEVRAVRFRTRAVGQEPREEVRKLQEEMKELTREQLAIRKSRELLQKNSAYLDKLEGFVAPTAKVELSQGVLKPEALVETSKFIWTSRLELLKDELDLTTKEEKLNEARMLLQRKLAELSSGNSKTVREAVLFIASKADGKATIKLNYLVSSCGWSPLYTLRGKLQEASTDKSQTIGVGVEYSALIHQRTGENWDDVKLTLSTASPALSAASPGLAPFSVFLKPAIANQAKQSRLQTQSEVVGKAQRIQGRKNKAIMDQRNVVDFAGNNSLSFEANRAANDFQVLELDNGKDVIQAIQEIEDAEEGPSLNYSLDTPVSLASRNDQQMVRILSTTFNGDFYHMAVPVLTSFVYREAELKNLSDVDLLAGPTTVYLDGKFVGRGEIPMVARGQTFVVGLGADPQIRAHRELVDRSEQIQGGNREVSFEYSLSIENFKETPATVRLFDRLPYSKEDKAIRVELGKMSDELSADSVYVKIEKPKGILRWDIVAKANAVRDDVQTVTYGYKFDFDRNFRLTTLGTQDGGENGMPASPAMQEDMFNDFEMLQKARLKF